MTPGYGNELMSVVGIFAFAAGSSCVLLGDQTDGECAWIEAAQCGISFSQKRYPKKVKGSTT